MEKAIHSAKQAILLDLLRKARKRARLTQTQLGALIDEPQSLVSDIERGERRADLVELLQITRALNVPLVDLVKQFVERVEAETESDQETAAE